MLTLIGFFISLGLTAMPNTATTLWRVSLVVVGAFGSLWAFWMLQVIRTDLAALASAMDPQHDSGTLGSETVSSSLSGTR